MTRLAIAPAAVLAAGYAAVQWGEREAWAVGAGGVG